MATYQQTEASKQRVEILRQTSMEAILQAEGFDTMHKAKGNYHSPFRKDNDPSFHIDEANHRWYDHGTGEGGDVINLVMKLKNLSFRGALDYLEKFNPDVVALKADNGPKSGEAMSAALSGYVNHSGGAYGSDTEWGNVGKKYGVESKHYYHGSKTPNGNTVVSEADFKEGVEKVNLAAKTLGRRASNPNVLDLLGRNWMQVRESEAVFAIGKLNPLITHQLPSGQFYSEVEGGTGWAVQMAIDADKPVYVFDINTNAWYFFKPGAEVTETGAKCWEKMDKTPILTKTFAGVGTRQITPEGRAAIADAYKATIRLLLESKKQDDFMEQIDKTTRINIWAGSHENENLSNMAIRPFVIEGKLFRTVEHRFQYRKAIFAGDENTAKMILESESPYEAKLFGRQVKGLDNTAWDKVAPKEMEAAIRLSFMSNPEAAEALMLTGNALLTHEQEKGIWKEEFPRILMKVRHQLLHNILDSNGVYHGSSTIEVTGVNEKITSPSLRSYEIEKRGIHPAILDKYCVQVEYTVKFNNMEKQAPMSYPAIGFKNRSNFYTLRGIPYKGNETGIKRTTGNDISVIDKDGNPRYGQEDTPSHKNVVIFEGFNDFLSWLCWRDCLTPENSDVVVLNSTVNVQRGMDYILAHENVYAYMDADKSGIAKNQVIENACRTKGVSFKDCSYFYAKRGCKDFNEAWRAEKTRRVKAGQHSKLDALLVNKDKTQVNTEKQETKAQKKKSGKSTSNSRH